MTKKKGFLLAVVVFIGLSYACGHDSNQSTESKPSTSQSQEAKAPSKSEVAYDKFVNLPMGSSYEQVKNALGVEGKLTHENVIADIKTQSYDFGVDNAHMTLMFQNGALNSKSIASLAFLKPSGNKITLDQFNQIQAGMTYDQVKQILGSEGRLSTQTEIMGVQSSLYTWMNSGGSNIVITFGGDGTVDSKTQMGLK